MATNRSEQFDFYFKMDFIVTDTRSHKCVILFRTADVKVSTTYQTASSRLRSSSLHTAIVHSRRVSPGRGRHPCILALTDNPQCRTTCCHLRPHLQVNAHRVAHILSFFLKKDMCIDPTSVVSVTRVLAYSARTFTLRLYGYLSFFTL